MTIVLLHVTAIYWMFPVPLFIKEFFCQVNIFTGFRICGRIRLAKFKVCKSVHRHTIQINHQLDATIFPVYYLMFMYSSTRFGRPHAHHQELNNCISSHWFYLRRMLIAVFLVVVWPVALSW
jgi:hypothetical protein